MVEGLRIVGGVELYFTNCYQCKTQMAMSGDIYRAALERAGSMQFYCPNGHGQVFAKGESEEDKIRRERDRLRQKLAEKDDEIRHARQREQEQRERAEHTERRLSAARGQVTKIKRRASNGVCPCCNRTFADLARHMHSKHPGFVSEPDASEHVN